MFHLMTHAFFKATLFLTAGLVIHALTGEQDIRNMGGLRKLMPFTFLAFVAGSLALAGIPPFSGFFSKDPIISSALATGGARGDIIFVVAVTGALLTGMYAFRLVFRVFLGEPSAFVREHLHTDHGEGPLSMRWTVGVLAVLATIGGFIQFPPFWDADHEVARAGRAVARRADEHAGVRHDRRLGLRGRDRASSSPG